MNIITKTLIVASFLFPASAFAAFSITPDEVSSGSDEVLLELPAMPGAHRYLSFGPDGTQYGQWLAGNRSGEFFDVMEAGTPSVYEGVWHVLRADSNQGSFDTECADGAPGANYADCKASSAFVEEISATLTLPPPPDDPSIMDGVNGGFASGTDLVENGVANNLPGIALLFGGLLAGGIGIRIFTRVIGRAA
jgi:hypothetical protein